MSPRLHLRRRSGLALTFAAVASVALMLAGCTATPTSPATTPAPSASITPAASDSVDPDPGADSACGLLDDETIMSLIGDTAEGTVITVPGSDLPACQYGTLGERGVQVAQVPAAEWAQSLPSIAQTILELPEGAVDEKIRSQIEAAVNAIAGGEKIAPDEACSYFSQLLEAAGQEPGQSFTVNYLPDQATAVAITGQQCSDGKYTSVVVSRDGLPDDETIIDEVIAVLEKLS